MLTKTSRLFGKQTSIKISKTAERTRLNIWSEREENGQIYDHSCIYFLGWYVLGKAPSVSCLIYQKKGRQDRDWQIAFVELRNRLPQSHGNCKAIFSFEEASCVLIDKVFVKKSLEICTFSQACFIFLKILWRWCSEVDHDSVKRTLDDLHRWKYSFCF